MVSSWWAILVIPRSKYLGHSDWPSDQSEHTDPIGLKSVSQEPITYYFDSFVGME